MTQSTVGDLVLRTRRHHAIEHAAIAVLFELFGQREGVGALSDPWGFGILSGYEGEEVQSAAEEALERLREGPVEPCDNRTMRKQPRRERGGCGRRCPGGRAWPLGHWVQREITTDTSGMDEVRITSAKGRKAFGTRSFVRVTIGRA